MLWSTITDRRHYPLSPCDCKNNLSKSAFTVLRGYSTKTLDVQACTICPTLLPESIHSELVRPLYATSDKWNHDAQLAGVKVILGCCNKDACSLAPAKVSYLSMHCNRHASRIPCWGCFLTIFGHDKDDQLQGASTSTLCLTPLIGAVGQRAIGPESALFSSSIRAHSFNQPKTWVGGFWHPPWRTPLGLLQWHWFPRPCSHSGCGQLIHSSVTQDLIRSNVTSISGTWLVPATLQ